MINQFRNLNPVNLLILFAYTFFMRIALFADLPAQLNFEFLESYTRFFIKIPVQSFFSPASNVFFAGIIIYIQSILFNRVVNNHGLLNKPGFLPALMYISGASLFMPFLVLSPTLMCNFLLIWMMDKFLKIGKSPNAIMIMFWLALLLYRSFNWREWVSGLVGFLIIFFFVAVFY